MDKLTGVAAIIIALIVLIVLLVDIQYFVAIVAILGGVFVAYAGRGNTYVAVLGGAIAIAGIVLAALAFTGGAFTP
jgi:predicted membrane protein